MKRHRGEQVAPPASGRPVTRRSLLKVAAAGAALGFATPLLWTRAGRSAGARVMRLGYDQDIVKLDFGVSQATVDVFATALIFGRLVNYDRGMQNPLADVAESWTVAPDNVTYTFKIRRGVLFHSGRELTADDVAYSFHRGAEIGPKGRFAGYMVSLESYKATGPYEFQVKLKQPDASFFSNLAAPSVSICDPKTVDQIETRPVGTGPYMFVEWVPGDHVTYRKFPKYWNQALLGKLPDEIVTTVIAEDLTRVANLKSGQIDVATSIPAQLRKDIQTTAGLHLLRQDFSPSYACIDFNLRRPPFDNVKLRQALAHAVNRAAINKNVFFGTGQPGCNLIPPGHWAYTDLGCPAFDLGAAKKLVDASGAALPVRAKARLFNKPDWAGKAFEIIQHDWNALGVQLDIETMDFGLYVQDVWVGKNADLTVGSYTREADPDGLFSSVLRKDQGNNFMGYYNPTVEALFDKAKATRDRTARRTMYAQLLHIAVDDDVPLIKMQSIENAWAANDKVKDLTLLPNNTPALYQPWAWAG
ncbi:MAG TPA: ABC transporter substrate-binding protein [bacterium]|nr:ABC transporter substrate-binding protein [bacterium]